ncbi:MAG: hypothetical protein A2Y86_05305 [Candidatus Aminicenantes bacterium RBG_13_62_12]|nr:MAG: hypothetical protein A2Y86_05305 [Candidatus Aminicenantes bacterium RBG_13_62_12]
MGGDRRVYSSSLYEDREIGIDGQVFKLHKINKATLDAVERNAKDPKKTAYDQLAVLVDAPLEFLEATDIRLVQQIFADLVAEYKLDLGTTGEEKKEPGPGGTSSPE